MKEGEPTLNLSKARTHPRCSLRSIEERDAPPQEPEEREDPLQEPLAPQRRRGIQQVLVNQSEVYTTRARRAHLYQNCPGLGIVPDQCLIHWQIC